MELPTYTSIWRIEKRLYKLYDFRLPMPLPVGQIAVFTAVTVPYVVLLTLFGLPFNHSLFWLYVLPPGLLTWLATRPVLESKRLPELLISQARYLGEPSIWCRMAPLAEKDQVVVFGRVWRRASVAATAEAGIAGAEQDQAVAELPVIARPALPVATPVGRPVAAHADATGTVPARRAKGRQARGRLVRQREVPERLAPEDAPADPPRDEWVQQRPKPRENRWARAAGTAQRTPAGGRPEASVPGPSRPPGPGWVPEAGRALDARRAPGQAGEAQGTPAAGAGWARDVTAGTWRDPGLAGMAGQGRHAAPGRPAPAGPPAPSGYAAGARPMRPATSGPVTDGPVAGGPVIGGAGQPSRDSGTGKDAGTGWPMVGYGTAAGARSADPAAAAWSDDPAQDSGPGRDYVPDRNAGADAAARWAAGTGWPVGYPPATGMRPAGPPGPVSPALGYGVASGADAASGRSAAPGPGRAAEAEPSRAAAPSREADPAAGAIGGASGRPEVEPTDGIVLGAVAPGTSAAAEAAPGGSEPASAGPAASAPAVPDTPTPGRHAAAGPRTWAAAGSEVPAVAGPATPGRPGGMPAAAGPASPTGRTPAAAGGGAPAAAGPETPVAPGGMSLADGPASPTGSVPAAAGGGAPAAAGGGAPAAAGPETTVAPGGMSLADGPASPTGSVPSAVGGGAPAAAGPETTAGPGGGTSGSAAGPEAPAPTTAGPEMPRLAEPAVRPGEPAPAEPGTAAAAGPDTPAVGQWTAAPAGPGTPPVAAGLGGIASSLAAQPPAPEPAAAAEAPAPDASAPERSATDRPGQQRPAPEASAPDAPAPEAPATQHPPPPAIPRRPPPVVIVPAKRSLAGPPPATPARPQPSPVERALSRPGDRRATGWRGHVTVVPGGRGPGRPDHVKEARARAVLPLDRPRLVVVLGCTVGAGQTVTTLMLADLLAGLRGEPVAALDLNPGPASLTELAHVPAITVSALLADRPPGAHAANGGHRSPAPGRGAPARGARTRGRLDVISQDAAPDGGTALPNLQHERLISVLASRYPLTFADPGAPAVAKLLAEAGQLVLVAPASPDAAQAVSMTSEYLAGHGHGALARHSIAVLNGVSQRSVRHAEQAEHVLRGRCRAIVRVPWDDHLAEPEAERGIRDSLEAADGPPRLARLRPAVLQAYTALAGVLISSLTDDPARRRAAR